MFDNVDGKLSHKNYSSLIYGPIGHVIDSHPVISHPFLNAFKKGGLTMQQIRFWAKQQFFFSISLPSAFAAIYARLPDRYWREKHAIVDLIKVEAWGSEEKMVHSYHFIKLCNFLGIAVDQLDPDDATPYTKEYLAARLEICLNSNRPLGQGLVAIAFGNEVLNLYIFQSYREGIHKIPGMEFCPTSYFDAHINDEEEDAQVFLGLLSKVVTSDKELQLAQEGLMEILDKRVQFLDHLWEDISKI